MSFYILHHKFEVTLMNELTKFSIEFLRVLGDHTRLEIIELLKSGPKTSKEIQMELEKSQPTISQHLKTLCGSNLIIFELKENKNKKKLQYYRIKDKDLLKLLSTIYSFVARINNEKVKDLRDLDIYDTLL